MTGTELAILIQDAGTDQSKLARELGITPRYVRQLLAGDRPVPPELEKEISQRFGIYAEDVQVLPRLRAILTVRGLKGGAAAQRLGCTAGELRGMLSGKVPVPISTWRKARALV